MRRNLTAAQANHIQECWNRANGPERRAMVADLKKLPTSYLALSSETTGYPVVGCFPFGATDWPVEVAIEAGRKIGVIDSLVLSNGQWFDSVDKAQEAWRTMK